MVSPNIDNAGMTFDLIYREGRLDITSTAYGGDTIAYFELKEGIAYIPVVTTYSSSDTRPVKYNVKPCSHECETCDYSTTP